jgi:hypothetical protein
MPATPTNPGGPPGYALTWERASDQALPNNAPPGWAVEYDKAVRHGGEPQVRTAAAPAEPVRRGTHSVRFQLYKGDRRINCGVRCELAVDPPEPPRTDPAIPTERWYGFSVFLPYTWAPDPAPESVTQWHQVTEGGSPPLAILTTGDDWIVSQRDWSNVAGNNTIEHSAGPFARREWTDWVVHVRWSAASDGLLEIWRNGQRVPGFAPKRGRNTFSNSSRHYMKIGIYKWQWNDAAPVAPGCPKPGPDHSMQSRRVMYHDEVRIVDARGTYATVAPPGNRPPPVP